MSPYKLVFGKPCHLPLEQEYKAMCAIKKLNFYFKAAKEDRLLQLNELEELRKEVYDSARIYKVSMLSFKKNNKRELNNFNEKRSIFSPNSQNLCWKYQESKNSRNLIQFIHKKFKERINGLVVPKRRKITIKGWENNRKKK